MLRIGKNLTNDLVIKDRAAEDFHCILYLSNSELVVEDLKSHYGTLVNGSRITHAILYPGDELQIGFTRIEWQKLMPALQAIGDTTDAESFLQSQDLNLEVRDEEPKNEQKIKDSILAIDYKIDSTAELLDKALNELTLRELDYQITVNPTIEDKNTEPIKSDTPSEETVSITPNPLNNNLVGSTEVTLKTEKLEIGRKQLQQKNPYKVYYVTLIAMLAIMILSGLLIAVITS